MKTFLGPFHPDLEDALVREILAKKERDPLAPLLLLVPSDSLRRRLKVLLAAERQLDLLNFHILTFHQLSLRIHEEIGGASSVNLRDEAFLEEILRQMIRLRLPGTSGFWGIEEKAGGCGALWQTLRDLKDGMVDPQRALEALEEGIFERDGQKKIAALFTLFDAFLSRLAEWEIQDYSDLDRLAAERIPSSEFLRLFSHIFYYGFYDLTQVQLDVLRAIARFYPVTVFFPLIPGARAWAFAERFYEQYLHGHLEDSLRARPSVHDIREEERKFYASSLPLFSDEPEGQRTRAAENFRCAILSSFGPRDEITAAAKEILRLHSRENISFDQIGVVARSLDPYLPWIQEIFAEHRIPIRTSAEQPAVQFPLAKAALLLLNLPLKGYLRSHFIDLVSSPFFNRALCADGETLRTDLCDLLTRRLGISKGFAEWRRLEREFSQDVAWAKGQDEEEDFHKITVPALQIRLLWNLFSELHRDLETLPREASWSEYASAWKTLLEKYLGVSGEMEPQARSRDDLVKETILQALERLSGLDVLGVKVSLAHFIETYQYWLERSSIPLTQGDPKGVAVLDAMAARGVPFRALLILGLNEGVFPRTIREDAFLRDRERRVLETVLGYKVSEKLAAFDEEKLLFALLVGAASERLYCFHQRSDETGRVLVPSWYLSELRRALSEANDSVLEEITIPRGIVEKEKVRPFDRNELILPHELAVRLTLKSEDPAPLIGVCSLLPFLYNRGRKALQNMEASARRLGEYDGFLGRRAELWERLSAEGLSPTALELYARCPFQFFARQVLGLERLERPEETDGPAPSEVGQLVHLILKSFYQELIERGYFAGSPRSLDIRDMLKQCVRTAFADYESKNPVGYPVAWETLEEWLTEFLTQAVERDLEELSQSGYRPVALEIESTKRLGSSWPGLLRKLVIRGRMDRIDYEPEQNRFRVIDYKFKTGTHLTAADKDLCRSALTGERLQPPFYLLLGKEFATRQGNQDREPEVEADFYLLAPRWQDGPLVPSKFPEDGWDGRPGRSLRETISLLVEGIERGRFFIYPGEHCSRCEVSEICRKNHLPSLWRAENDPLAKPHRELRNRRPEKT